MMPSTLDIPGYKIEKLIAEGGMASVYLARQESLSRPVALKLLRKFDNESKGQDEGPLVDRLKRGEEAAFEQLVREHGPRMLAVARRFLPQDADAQDALQDAFVNVTRGIHTFDGQSRLATWLHRVVVNAALMRIRSRDRRGERPMEAEALDAVRESRGRSAWTWSASDLLSRAELRHIVREEIARLPETCRVVLLLRDVEGRDLREIASLLDLGLTTVKLRLHNGRRALRAALEPRLAASEAS